MDTTEDIRAVPCTANGSDRLTEADVTAYLTAGGYGDEVPAIVADAKRFPCSGRYTADRHRYAEYVMPGGYWLAGDCTDSEERIKRLARARKGN